MPPRTDSPTPFSDLPHIPPIYDRKARLTHRLSFFCSISCSPRPSPTARKMKTPTA